MVGARHAEPQRRAPRLPEGHAREPARRDVGVTAELSPGSGADVAPPLSSGTSLQAPDRIADSGFASLVGRSHLSLLVILASLAAALFWGAAHALSPGHGKTIITAYLVGQRGTPRHAALLGLIVTITHTIGVFSLGLVTLALSQFIVPDRLYPWLNLVSGLLVVGDRRLGAARRAGGTAGTHHHHHHHHGEEGTSFRSLLAVGVSGGLLPCPSALVVLLAAISLHRVAFGLLLILAFSAGLALTITGIGLAAVLARTAFRRVSLRRPAGSALASRQRTRHPRGRARHDRPRRPEGELTDVRTRHLGRIVLRRRHARRSSASSPSCSACATRPTRITSPPSRR